MGLYHRLRNEVWTTDGQGNRVSRKIPVMAFKAALGLWAQGKQGVTRAALISLFGLDAAPRAGENTSDQADLDGFLATHQGLGGSAQLQAIRRLWFREGLYEACFLAEAEDPVSGGPIITESEWFAIINDAGGMP